MQAVPEGVFILSGKITAGTNGTEEYRLQDPLKMRGARLRKTGHTAHLGGWAIDVQRRTVTLTHEARSIPGPGPDQPLELGIPPRFGDRTQP